MENGTILSPDEVKQRRMRAKEAKAVIEESIDKKIESFPGTAKVEYESMGRFTTPAVIYFKDYSTEDVTDIVMTQPENIVETLVPILNKMKVGSDVNDFDVSSMTVEDFIETLISLKAQFNTVHHKHPYMCECQYMLPEADQKVQEGDVNLLELKYRSIAEVEELYKEETKKSLEELSDKEWITYRKQVAKEEGVEAESITKESIIDKIEIKEPFTIYSGEHKIVFRFTRIADVIKAQKFLDKEYAPQIKKIQNRVEHGVPGDVLKAKKEDELKEIQKQKTKKLITYIKAYSILLLDDRVLLDNEKIELIRNRDIFPRHITQDMDSFLDQLKHGVYQEIEFTCPSCGRANKESLHQSFSVTELLPINSKSERDNRQHTRLNIRFGA